MGTIIDFFRKEYDSSRGTGRPPSQWRYFGTMLEAYSKNATLEAPFACSVGRCFSYTIKGTENEQTDRVGRSRPGAQQANAQPAAAKGRKPFKSWAQEMQEKQLALKSDLNNEVKLLREAFERSTEVRAKSLDKLFEKL